MLSNEIRIESPGQVFFTTWAPADRPIHSFGSFREGHQTTSIRLSATALFLPSTIRKRPPNRDLFGITSHCCHPPIFVRTSMASNKEVVFEFPPQPLLLLLPQPLPQPQCILVVSFFRSFFRGSRRRRWGTSHFYAKRSREKRPFARKRSHDRQTDSRTVGRSDGRKNGRRTQEDDGGGRRVLWSVSCCLPCVFLLSLL